MAAWLILPLGAGPQRSPSQCNRTVCAVWCGVARCVVTAPLGAAKANMRLPGVCRVCSLVLVAQLESKLVKARAQEVTVDVGPLIDAVRDSIARAVLLAKTASCPMVHFLILDAFTAPALARALLDQVRRPMAFAGQPGPTFKLNTVIVGEVERLQVGLSELKHIEAFCSFVPVLWRTVRTVRPALWSARARAHRTAPPAVHVRWRARYRADVRRSCGVCIGWPGASHMFACMTHLDEHKKTQNAALVAP